jgi:hypothetical protein
MFRFLLFTSALCLSDGFHCPNLQSLSITRTTTPTFHSSPLFPTQRDAKKSNLDLENQQPSILQKVTSRFDTIESAGLKDARISGIVSKIHGPITYLALGLITGLRWNRCFRNPYYWLVMAFCLKWYRARYVFKIPVWDRQPNWNNIITSKEQEKDLKCFTCKICGSTLFIAKTREFFFEGNTGIGGLGCFSCGAKGKENFIMDRDRILEDVADMDDYFEYERPLDFVSAAERRKILKDAGGDEDKANKSLLERGDGDAESSETAPSTDSEEILDVEIEEGVANGAKEPKEDQPVAKEDPPVAEDEAVEQESEPAPEMKAAEKPVDPAPSTKKAANKEQPPLDDDDFDLDDLGMDDI